MVTALLVLAGLGWAAWRGRPDGASASPGAAPALVVRNGQLLDDATGSVVTDGVGRSGSEFSCLGGSSVFQGSVDDAAIAAMVSWHVQVVRVPLNEDCWLGINGVRPAVAGKAYVTAVSGYVERLQAHGMAVVLDLHWSAPGSRLATGQVQMADADHSPTLWREVAQRFEGDRSVAFDLFNEPYGISWSCWQSGCTVPGQGGHPAWQAVGMTQLLQAVRSTGATNVVLLGGLDHASNLKGWAEHVPADPTGQLAASWHLYSSPGCATSSCWAGQVASLDGAAMLVTELGETDCAGSFVGAAMSWLDRVGYGYLTWAWNTWTGCGGPPLITSYSGTPTVGYGEAVRAHYLDGSKP